MLASKLLRSSIGKGLCEHAYGVARMACLYGMNAEETISDVIELRVRIMDVMLPAVSKVFQADIAWMT
jgi:hypothetical protein